MLQHIQGRGIGAVFQGLPRLLIVFGVVLIAIIEFAARLPDLVLLPEKMQAAIGEYRAKELQPKVVTTQVEKTEADTRVAETQARLNAMQQEKVAAETKVAQIQADVTAAQVAKTQADTKLAQMQAALAATQAQKTQAETQLADAQTTKTNLEATQKTIGLALTAGMIGAGVKLYDMMTQPQDTTTAAQPDVPQQAPPQQMAAAQPLSRPPSPPARQPERSQQPARPTPVTLTNDPLVNDYLSGSRDAQAWTAFLAGSPLDVREGSEFWVSVKDNPAGHSCNEGKGATSAGFRKGCETARDRFAGIDRQFKASPNYRAGWRSVR